MKRLLAASLLLACIAGCSTSRGVHNIPVTRDYQQIEKASVSDAAAAVAHAHRVGAEHFAAYEYASAVAYLQMAVDSKDEGDKRGSWDYAALAIEYASEAVRNGSGIPDAGEYRLPDNYEACLAEFNRLKARHGELDAAKAIEVSPTIFAHCTAELSRAEHELNEPRQWLRAARRMVAIETDIETIWSQDVDGDNVVDMKDGAPWLAEDKDGFEDSDGVPDLDNDGDGVLDLDDVKPNDPETRNRWHDFDGEPDTYPQLEIIYYSLGSAAITSETKGYLRGVSTVLKEWPELKLHVRGHTDDSHTERFNQDLSQRRTEVVRNYLISAGAPESQIVVSFYGETQPANVNHSARDKAENRRVELILE